MTLTCCRRRGRKPDEEEPEIKRQKFLERNRSVCVYVSDVCGCVCVCVCVCVYVCVCVCVMGVCAHAQGCSQQVSSEEEAVGGRHGEEDKGHGRPEPSSTAGSGVAQVRSPTAQVHPHCTQGLPTNSAPDSRWNPCQRSAQFSDMKERGEIIAVVGTL